MGGRARPAPPRSFTCGELCRHVLRERCGIEVPEILADPLRLRSCVAAMAEPGRYNLIRLPEHGRRQAFDVVYFARVNREDHVGIAVDTPSGLKILHCQRGAGVTLDTPGELRGMGVRRLSWYRHRALHETGPA